MTPRLKDAIVSLAGNITPFEITDGKISRWDSGETKTNITQPTEEALTTELARLQAEYDAKDYARNRKAEYPEIAVQLDDIFHNGIDGWKATIQVTKDKYPKE